MKLLKLNKKTRFLFVAYCVMVVCFCFATPVHADGDPIQVVNNLSDFIFGLIRHWYDLAGLWCCASRFIPKES